MTFCSFVEVRGTSRSEPRLVVPAPAEGREGGVEIVKLRWGYILSRKCTIMTYVNFWIHTKMNNEKKERDNFSHNEGEMNMKIAEYRQWWQQTLESRATLIVVYIYFTNLQ